MNEFFAACTQSINSSSDIEEVLGEQVDLTTMLTNWKDQRRRRKAVKAAVQCMLLQCCAAIAVVLVAVNDCIGRVKEKWGGRSCNHENPESHTNVYRRLPR